MKRSMMIVAVALAGFIALTPTARAAQKSQSVDVLLGTALHQEEVEGDLEAAIETYKKILAAYPGNRQAAAEAQFRIGMCYERLGRREAQKAYEAVLSKYADQPEFAAKAQERLAALRSASAAAPPKDSRLAIRRVSANLDSSGNPSPDGRYLAYVDWDTASVAVFTVATGETRLLTKEGSWGNNKRYPENLVWSPDSRQIAYTWNMWDFPEGGGTELRIISPESGDSPKTVLRDERYIWPWDWAPDGSRILCGLQTGGPVMDRALVDVGTGAVETLNMPTGTLGRLYRFTPDGESILYSRASDGKWNPDDIYLYDLKTGDSKPVIEHAADDYVIGVLPGTEWLLFASDRRGSVDLWGIPFQKGQVRGEALLVKQVFPLFFPLSITNDGSLYYVTPVSHFDIFLADLDPSTQKVLVEPRRISSRWELTKANASFSPDGKRIAFAASWGSSRRANRPNALIVQALAESDPSFIVVDFSELHLEAIGHPSWAGNGQSIVIGGLRRETGTSFTRGLVRVDLPSLRKTEICWAPVGQVFAYPECARTTEAVYFVSRGGQDQSMEVRRIGLDGRDEKEIFRAPDGQAVKGIALSPDDKTLAIVTSPGTGGLFPCTLLLMPLEGGPPRRIHEFMEYAGGNADLAWAADGQSIFYIVKDKKEEAGRSLQRISVAGEASPETVFRRADGRCYAVASHPNGRTIAFTSQSGPATPETWVMENLKEELQKLAAEKR